MKFLAAFAIAILMTAPAHARPYDEIMAEAREAFAAENFETAAGLLDEAQADRPYSFHLTRNRVLARILTGRMDEAIAIAKEVADRGLVLETPPNDAFDKMRAEPAYAPVAARMEENAQPKGEAHITAEYAEDWLLPEAISQSRGRLLIGSVRSGVISAASDELAPFASADGGVFDIEQRKNAVYAAINNQLAYDGDREIPFAAIVKLDPKSGAMKERFALGPAPALIGDIEVAGNGRLFASDSLTPRIFDINQVKHRGATTKIISVISDPRFVNLQGLALDEKNGRLYVADYLSGLYAIDLKTQKVDAVANPANAHLGGIDGLYLYRGDLIGVQNGVSPQRIVRIDLDKNGAVALSLEVLQQAAPEWIEPTHGFIDGDEFVYIATSNWPAYDDNGSVRDGATLAPLRLMSVPLNLQQ